MPFDGRDFERSVILEKIDQVIGLLEREEQWCKGVMRSLDGRRCLAGAIRDAGAQLLLTPVLLQAIHETTGKRHWRIEAFNDAPATTHAEVTRVLHRARENIFSGRAAATAAHQRRMARWTLMASSLWRRFVEC